MAIPCVWPAVPMIHSLVKCFQLFGDDGGGKKPAWLCRCDKALLTLVGKIPLGNGGASSPGCFLEFPPCMLTAFSLGRGEIQAKAHLWPCPALSPTLCRGLLRVTAVLRLHHVFTPS